MTSKDGSALIDSVGIRLAGESSQTVALQGTLRVAGGDTDVIDIRCATFSGFGREASLFAIEVGELKFKA